MDARIETIAKRHTHAPMASVCAVAQSHIVFKIAPVPADNKLLGQEPKMDYPKAKGKTAETKTSKAPASSDRQVKREG